MLVVQLVAGVTIRLQFLFRFIRLRRLMALLADHLHMLAFERVLGVLVVIELLLGPTRLGVAVLAF